MNEGAEIRSRANADGSIDVWAEGWRIRFSGGSKPETFAEDKAPEDTVPGSSDVESGRSADGVWMCLGDWYVLIRESGPTVTSTTPKAASRGFAFHLYRRRRVE